ncbi:hypothetical protein [Prauserella cavernicola]|uniref:Uncharacterized protein n=1 Tax=Prauserella cavernicola TaxID=2800127 RepID=A0A934QRK2_9PSEU|nr:hypothetical protein [Prauserella cavernicola]MBK1785270.1 hypothetical protein [Prauserella cavernicola]
MRRNWVVAGVVAIAVVWLVVVTVLISREPETGASSPEQLRDRLEQALSTHDADELGLLLGQTGSEVDEFAGAYVDKLRGTTGLTVSLRPDGGESRVAVVEGARADGSAFAYEVSLSRSGDRWRLDLTPPL